MAQSKNQMLKKLKATPKYKKAGPKAKTNMRKESVDDWQRKQPKNWSAGKLAGKFKYSRAVLEATPELLEIYRKAYVKEWSDDRLRINIENSNWYRNNSTKWREVEETRLKNPAEFDQAVAARVAVIGKKAEALGATVDAIELQALATESLYGGWNDAELNDHLRAEIEISEGVGMFGEAGKYEMALRELANKHGVQYTDDWFRSNARESAVMDGVGDLEIQIREDSANQYEQWGDQIRQGTTNIGVKSGSYRKSLERMYDLEDGQASVFDPEIQKALTNRDSDNAVSTAPLWKFEQNLRESPKWTTTKNGAETMSNVAQGMLQEWGFLNNG